MAVNGFLSVDSYIRSALPVLESVEGFNQPFTPDHNFGSWFDLALTGSLGGGHWVAFNAIATTAHTIWGVIAGMILMERLESPKENSDNDDCGV